MRPTQTRCRTRRCGRGLNFNNFCHIYKRFRPPWRLHLVCAPPDFFVHNGTPILNVSCARCSFLSAPNEFLVEARQLELKGMSSRCRRGKRCSGIETVCSAGCLSDAHTFRGTRAVALDWKMRPTLLHFLRELYRRGATGRKNLHQCYCVLTSETAMEQMGHTVLAHFYSACCDGLLQFEAGSFMHTDT